MNMKKYIYILAASLMAFTSCDEILDKSPLDTFADENFWTGEGNVESYANTFFNNFSGYGNGGGGGTFYFPTLNDNQAGSGFRDWNYSDNLVSNGDWDSAYEEIRRACILINRVSGMSSLSSKQKANWKGVARMNRALQYYWLVREFGDVPLVLSELNNEDKSLFGERIDRDVVIDSALADINYAVANITTKSNKTGWSVDLANAMKAEICLFEGTYCKYRVAADGQKAPDATRATAYLKAAKEACLALMGSGYSLSKSYQSNYNSLDLKSNTEMILYKHYVKDVFDHSLVDYTCSSSQQNGMTKDAFDAFLFIDGKPKATTSEVKTDAASTFLTQGAVKLLDLGPLLSVRDPRLAVCIDRGVDYDDNHTYIRFFDKNRTDATPMTSSTGYSVNKFDTNELPAPYRVQTSYNYTDAPLYWYSVVLLEYAEACAELGACNQNDLDISVNLLRERVGMNDMSVSPEADPANNMNVSNLIWEIRRERRVELMFDNDFRFWDLNRWHQLDKLDTQKYPDIMLGANVTNDSNFSSSTVVKNGYIDASSGKVRTYESKFYFYPIPTSQIKLNEALTQNSGWGK